MITRRNIRYLCIVLLVFAVAYLAFLLYPRPLLAQMTACNATSAEVRFSCYRASIQRAYGSDVPQFVQFMQKNAGQIRSTLAQTPANADYAIFGTNCHTFFHAAGDFVATFSSSDLKTQIGYGTTDCTNGYTMGLYKRLALNDGYSLALLKEFEAHCKEGAQNQCSHEIGHVLNDKYTYSILKTLDGISEEQYGVKYPKEYNYVTLGEPNLNDAFTECEAILPDENTRAQCLTGVGHNLFLFAEFDPQGYRSIANQCEKTDAANKDHCLEFLLFRIGINNAAPLFLEQQYAEGNEVCVDAAALVGRSDLLSHCFLGLGGGIGLFVDSNFPYPKVTDENLKQGRSQLLGYARLCEHSSDGFAEKCIAGLLGTRFDRLYAIYGLHDERIDAVRSTLDSVFEVVG